MELPPYTIEQEVEIVEQAMAQCSLPDAGYAVTYEHELQSVQILVKHEAQANAKHFPCIRHAAETGLALVWFEDSELLQSYMAWEADLRRPELLAQAEAGLRERGKLEGLPERASFASDAEFAVALEEHCGLAPGSFLVAGEWGLTVQPKVTGEPLSEEEWERMTCMSAVMTYLAWKDDSLKIGFVGNEKARSSD